MRRAVRDRFAEAIVVSVAILSLLAAAPPAAANGGLEFEHIAAMRSVAEVAISPDGSAVAYTLNVPRTIGVGEDGSSWRELHVVSWPDGASRRFVGGEVRVSGVRFTPDGSHITYLAKRDGDEHTSVWVIPVDGGESLRLLGFDTAINDYRISPDGSALAFVADQPKSEDREAAEEQGFTQEVFEEDWMPKVVWIAPMPELAPPVANPTGGGAEAVPPRALALDGSAFHVRWSPDSRYLAVDVAPRPMVDDRYMFRTVMLVDAETGAVQARFNNQGKLGDFKVSPDGSKVAMIAASDLNDPAAGRLMVGAAEGGALRDLLPDLESHITHFAWRDDERLIFISAEGVETRLGEVHLGESLQKTYAVSGPGERGARVPIMSGLSLSEDGTRVATAGNQPTHPGEVYAMTLGEPAVRRLTDSNPWLADIELHPQEVFVWRAADGLELEGPLIRPRNSSKRGPLPLIMFVHGGPEGHRSNGWLTRYSSPAQVAADRGYVAFFPNYRGSTGRGVEFSKLGQSDAAGKEFDDLIDAVEALVDRGIVDADRVGVTGGSYGGYATAWLATRHTEMFRAGVMFVGISNKVSKGLTTEIPREDILVHTRFQPYENWQFSLERSPIFWAEKARTPLLIAGGTDDKRVHPSQSLQLYRALKLVGKVPVRYVRYPGEGHGNSRAASRDDYGRRLMRWMDHFVQEKKTGLPPWELDRE